MQGMGIALSGLLIVAALDLGSAIAFGAPTPPTAASVDPRRRAEARSHRPAPLEAEARSPGCP